ncbi:G patch domain and ankyrin repeat-containing protein 1 [Haplosporangium gracile]|nr:G patch domain and ankyrin repeat-containing protein 1 [Haplosporangium gracile]
MTHRAVGKNRVLRKDESGTYYKDIVFVPSGGLSMNNPSSDSISSSTRSREEDINEIREFYKSVLAMPKTEAQPVWRRKSPALKKVSGATKSAPLSGTVASTATKQAGSTNSSSKPGSSITSSAVPSSISAVLSQQPAAPSSTTLHLPGSNTNSSTSTAPTLQSPKVTPDEIVRRNWSQSISSNSISTEATSPPKRTVAEGYVLCEPCQMEVRQDDLNRHRRGTAHLMSQELPVKPIDTLTLGYENKGFRMLVNSGWDYEKGLGAEGQGARHPVATRLKHDRLALGAAGTSKKVVTHTFEEIEGSRAKRVTKSDRRVPLNADDYRKKAEKERRDRVRMMTYMKK